MHRLIYRRSKTHTDQSGQASIIITLILMLVMGSITIGITELTSHNSREALDTQLGIQANYAAESGVNDAIYAIQHGGTVPPINNSTNCQTFMKKNGLSGIIDSNLKVSYTCLTVNESPENLQSSVSDDKSVVLRINPSSPTHTLKISWKANNTGPGYGLANCTQPHSVDQFVPQAVWACPYSMLRMDLFSIQALTNYTSSQTLENDTDSFFLFPVQGGGGSNTIDFGNLQKEPAILPVDCTATTCTETFNINPSLSDGYIRLTSIYGNAGVVSIASASGISFDNAQVEIDSTGIAQNELQRIDVRVPANYSTPTFAPNYAVDAGTSLCKRYILQGPTGTADPPLSDPYNPPDNTLPLCGNALKPAIYLYPTHAESVTVKISYPTGLAASIPSYNPTNGWNVVAQPDGTLTNTSDGKTYPYLYWEGNTDVFNFDMTQGFVVPGKDSAAFLTKELTIMGLHKNEIAAFLQYWVPKLQNNPYSLIHFAGSDYTKMAPLSISPKPDSVLRVFMAEEPISQPVAVTPQHFKTFHRSGFTVVEWGGTVL